LAMAIGRLNMLVVILSIIMVVLGAVCSVAGAAGENEPWTSYNTPPQLSEVLSQIISAFALPGGLLLLALCPILLALRRFKYATEIIGISTLGFLISATWYLFGGYLQEIWGMLTSNPFGPEAILFYIIVGPSLLTAIGLLLAIVFSPRLFALISSFIGMFLLGTHFGYDPINSVGLGIFGGLTWFVSSYAIIKLLTPKKEVVKPTSHIKAGEGTLAYESGRNPHTPSKIRKRPIGVTAIAILFIWWIGALFYAVALFIDVLACIVPLIFLILYAIAAAGLLKLKDWARKLSIAVLWINIIVGLHSRAPPLYVSEGLMVAIIITWYLKRPSVKEAFRPELLTPKIAAPPPATTQLPTSTSYGYCPFCGALVQPEYKFCSSCGKQIKTDLPQPEVAIDRCPFCGVEVQPDDIFCTNCGRKLKEIKE